MLFIHKPITEDVVSSEFEPLEIDSINDFIHILINNKEKIIHYCIATFVLASEFVFYSKS